MCIITLWTVMDGLWKVFAEVSNDFMTVKVDKMTFYHGIKDP